MKIHTDILSTLSQRIWIAILTTLFISKAATVTVAQTPVKPTTADIHAAIKKLNVLGSVLYVAAHPDDENTRLIAYMANERMMNTAYLSLTRGDGGQNLIGTEIRSLLGVIRTQELLMARSVDGGQQMFSRANDFGYSKNPAETLTIWDKDLVMADVIWAIRKFRPDVIVNRFSHDVKRRTHGHHTTSAILSFEAFDLANDENVYPEQLKYVDTWQPTRLFFNTSWWFYGSREKFNTADKSDMLSVDIGVYYPWKGKSNNEIAAESRSMHKCQGFGSMGERGSQMEYLQFLKGEQPEKDIFEGINTTWSRVDGGEDIGKMVSAIDRNFDANDPAASVPALLKVYKSIQALADTENNRYWKEVKSKEIKAIIQGCLGLYIEAVADDYSATFGDTVDVSIEVISRLGENLNIKLQRLILPNSQSVDANESLVINQKYLYTETFAVTPDFGNTAPYWLNDAASLGMYSVQDQLMRGLPETPKSTQVTFEFLLNDVEIAYTKEIIFKRRDPVKGEVYRPFEVTPPVFVNMDEDVYVFPYGARTITGKVLAGSDAFSGAVKLELPKGWEVSPASIPVQLTRKGEAQSFSFEITPPKGQSVEQVKAVVTDANGRTYNQRIDIIEYDHIPTQTVLQTSVAKIVKMEIEKKGDNIGYIMGAGDVIPACLAQLGYKVTLLEDSEITADNLKQYDAVILGIRAYNTRNSLKFLQKELFQYVENGGTMIAQYNTSFRLVVDEVAPFPLTLSRDRVSVEGAPVKFLQPDHPVLNMPNKITQKDFEGWVQERGLYFPNKWDDKFAAILSSNDPNETPKDGGLLVANYGKGYFVYSGYSWFRELPAGVPGAYRLFVNLISIGK